jgi:hypothetical protein
MSGGLLTLVAYGAQNAYVSGNPSVSFFAKSFVKYTHFALETQEVALGGASELGLDAAVTLRGRVQRAGDLLTDLVLAFDVPDVWSRLDVDGSGNLARTPRAFAWIRQLGARVIESVSLTIANTTVQTLSGDWIAAKAALDQPSDAYGRWAWMVGDVPELYAPAGGVYAAPSGGYPNAGDPAGGNAPSLPGRTVRVPLGLWFSEAPSLALPLIALTGADVDVSVTLRRLREWYTVADAAGNRGRWGVGLGAATDASGNAVPPALNTAYVAVDDPLSAPRYFLVDAPGVAPYDAWPLKPRLEATFAFLTSAERSRVSGLNVSAAAAAAYASALTSRADPDAAAAATRAAYSTLPPPLPPPLAGAVAGFPVRQLRQLFFPGLAGGTVALDLAVYGLVTRIVWQVRRSDALPYRNDFGNFTGWKDAGAPPFVRSPTATPGASSSGLLAFSAAAARFPLLSATVLSDGTPLFAARGGAYFADYAAWRGGGGGGGGAMALSGLAATSAPYPLYVYSFALAPASPTQPSGTWNSSRVRQPQLQVTLAPPPPPPFSGGVPVTWDVTVWVETLNQLVVAGNMGGMQWAT